MINNILIISFELNKCFLLKILEYFYSQRMLVIKVSNNVNDLQYLYYFFLFLKIEKYFLPNFRYG